MTQLLNDLTQAMKTGLIDKNITSDERLQPKLFLNDRDRGEKVLSSILDTLGKFMDFQLDKALEPH
jgi:HKD family nuclease